MAADDMMAGIAGRAMGRVGGFPVVRTGGKSATGMAIGKGLLEQGHAVQVNHAGMISYPWLGEPRSGAVRLAIETGSPIVPTATWGNQLGRNKAGGLQFAIGKAIEVGPARTPQPFEIAALREQLQYVTEGLSAQVHARYDAAIAASMPTAHNLQGSGSAIAVV